MKVSCRFKVKPLWHFFADDAQQLTRLNSGQLHIFTSCQTFSAKCASYVYLWDCNSRMLGWLSASVSQKFPSFPWPALRHAHSPTPCKGGTFGLVQKSFRDLPKDNYFQSETVIRMDIVPPRLKLPLKEFVLQLVLWLPNGVNVHSDKWFVDGRSSMVACGSVRHQFSWCAVLLFRITSSKLQPRATISMHLNWTWYLTLQNTVVRVYCVQSRN